MRLFVEVMREIDGVILPKDGESVVHRSTPDMQHAPYNTNDPCALIQFGERTFVIEGVGVIAGVCPTMTPGGKRRFPVAGKR